MTDQRATKTARRQRQQTPKHRTPLGWVRRFNTLVLDFTADLGGGALSNADTALVRQAAALTIRAEQAQAALLAGEAADDDALVRLSNASARLLNMLGAKQSKRPSRPYGLADIQAALASDNDDEEQLP
jgi:hypothetical protein